jgi:hypothetical protein
VTSLFIVSKVRESEQETADFRGIGQVGARIACVQQNGDRHPLADADCELKVLIELKWTHRDLRI